MSRAHYSEVQLYPILPFPEIKVRPQYIIYHKSEP